jgi:hypothetical protein
MLRNLIWETPRNILPKDVNIGDIIAGEVKPPNLLRTFFESLIANKLCFIGEILMYFCISIHCDFAIPIQVSRLIKKKVICHAER